MDIVPLPSRNCWRCDKELTQINGYVLNHICVPIINIEPKAQKTNKIESSEYGAKCDFGILKSEIPHS